MQQITSEIQAWRNNGRIYSIGLDILLENAPDLISGVFDITKHIPSPKNKDRLMALLVELESRHVHKVEEPESVTQFGINDLKNAPKEVQDFFASKELMYARFRFLHSEYLNQKEEDQEAWCIQIMEAWYSVQAHWQVLDVWKSTGVLTKLKTLDFKTIRKKIRNAETYISRYKKAGNQKLLEKYQAQKKELEKMYSYE